MLASDWCTVLGEDWRHGDIQVAQILVERSDELLQLGLCHIASPEWVESKGKSTRSVGDDIEVAIGASIRESSKVGKIHSHASPEGVGAQGAAHCEVKGHGGDWNLRICLNDQGCHNAECA
jgi:hypothetical protein